jgi:hypothetical protein
MLRELWEASATAVDQRGLQALTPEMTHRLLLVVNYPPQSVQVVGGSPQSIQ